ncbi:hypothetical protein [Streptomyces sp. NPDC060205]|uniref:hypothetical protein n=1 Tax=Streptomyces sp. NPDC060205 TaxID=3347072 RepID=UPI003654EEAF
MTAGEWFSYYDGVTGTAPGGLDIDHMVPLAEASDSAGLCLDPGPSPYANDLNAERSLGPVRRIMDGATPRL